MSDEPEFTAALTLVLDNTRTFNKLRTQVNGFEKNKIKRNFKWVSAHLRLGYDGKEECLALSYNYVRRQVWIDMSVAK